MAASGISEYLPPENAQELLRRYAGGERRFPGVELSDADLAGAMLDGTDFEGSWFCDASFEGASLRGTSFRLCNVKCANFRRADLTSSSFQLAAVEATEFRGGRPGGGEPRGAGYYGYTVHDGDGFPNGGSDV